MKGQTNRSILHPKLQRSLRSGATDAERALWQRLRARQLGRKFRRQHPFGDFILDFVCLERKLVVELDGSQHAERVDADTLRTNFLERAGFEVLRFWNNQVFEDPDGVIEAIWQALQGRAATHPHPGPPLEGEREEQRSLDKRPANVGKPSPSGGGLGGGGFDRGIDGNPFDRSRPLEGEGATHPHPGPPLEGEGDKRGGL